MLCFSAVTAVWEKRVDSLVYFGNLLALLRIWLPSLDIEVVPKLMPDHEAIRTVGDVS